jgi:hypothetical protein
MVSPSLKNLDLTKKDYNICASSMKIIARALEKNNSITSLCFGRKYSEILSFNCVGTSIGDEGALALARVLERTKNISSLFLTSNKLS